MNGVGYRRPHQDLEPEPSSRSGVGLIEAHRGPRRTRPCLRRCCPININRCETVTGKISNKDIDRLENTCSRLLAR